MSDDLFLIAEAGVNHNGDVDLGLRLIDAAAEAGADAVKFQTFRTEALVTNAAPAAAYQRRQSGEDTQAAFLKALELTPEEYLRLDEHAHAAGVRFMSTAFDPESLRFLIETFDMRPLKIPSGEITNPDLLLEFGRARRPLIVSTGMADLSDIEFALGVIALGRTEPERTPSIAACADAFSAAQNGSAPHALKDVSLLHCVTEYPAPIEQTNLRAMDTMRAAFGLPVGYSDHTLGVAASIAAVARGASVIEKHFTLDKSMRGPDHAASLEPGELSDLVKGCRDAAAALGTGRKTPVPAEMGNRQVARRSVVASRPILPGEMFGPENLTVKRAPFGPPGRMLWSFYGQSANRRYAADEPIA